MAPVCSTIVHKSGGENGFQGIRGEEHEGKKDGEVWGGRGGSKDKANQTVNNCGTAERKGCERHGVLVAEGEKRR